MDGLPKHICLNCHNDLVNYNKFRLLCTASDSHFRQNLIIKTEHTNEGQNENLVIADEEVVENVEEHLQSDVETSDINDESKGGTTFGEFINYEGHFIDNFESLSDPCKILQSNVKEIIFRNIL